VTQAFQSQADGYSRNMAANGTLAGFFLFVAVFSRRSQDEVESTCWKQAVECDCFGNIIPKMLVELAK
jgi:hypothetical protein